MFNPEIRTLTNTDRMIIASEQEWKCEMCEKLLSAHFEVDHILAWSNGGRSNRDNLRALCRNCHGEKSYKERRDPFVGFRCKAHYLVHSKFFPCDKNNEL